MFFESGSALFRYGEGGLRPINCFRVVRYSASSSPRIWLARLPSLRPSSSLSLTNDTLSFTDSTDIMPSRALFSKALFMLSNNGFISIGVLRLNRCRILCGIRRSLWPRILWHIRPRRHLLARGLFRRNRGSASRSRCSAICLPVTDRRI